MECKNCQSPLLEPNNYCSSCGAKVIRNRLTIRNLWEDFSAQFLNYDNKFLKTFVEMFRKPDQVIGAYLNGTRKKYVNVLNYFAIALTLSGIQIFILRKFAPDVLDVNAILPANAPQDSGNVDWVYDYLSLIALLSLPIYGLLARLSFFGLKKFNYTEHLVIMTYVVAQFSILNVFILTPSALFLGANYYIMGYCSNFVLMVFTAYTYKRLYPLSLGGIVLRSFLFLGLLLILLIAIGIIQFIFMLISAGSFEEFMRQQKELQGISYMVSSAMNWTS